MNTPTQQYGTDDALAFLDGTGRDAAGRSINDYFEFDADKWEECHNHVQWAFPSHIMSRFNLNAPVVDMDDFTCAISQRAERNIYTLMGNYLESLGFHKEDGKWRANLDHDRAKIWLSPGNHNYQRISRLLNLLSYLNPDLAIELLGEFLDVAGKVADWRARDHFGNLHAFISMDTVVYWSKAAIRKL